MKRAGWPADDSPRRKGTRRVRLWTIAIGSRILGSYLTEREALETLEKYPPGSCIRRAVAAVRFVDPAPKETR